MTRRPAVSLIAGLGVMALLSIPMFSMRMGTPDDGTKATSTTQRQAYDLLAEGFGPGFNGPPTAVVDLTGADDRDAALAATVDAAERSPGVFAVGEPSVNEAGDTAVVPVIPDSGPASDAGRPRDDGAVRRKAWWLPRWLERLLPNVDVEGQHLMERLQPAPTEPTPGEPQIVRQREPVG